MHAPGLRLRNPQSPHLEAPLNRRRTSPEIRLSRGLTSAVATARLQGRARGAVSRAE